MLFEHLLSTRRCARSQRHRMNTPGPYTRGGDILVCQGGNDALEKTATGKGDGKGQGILG